MAKVHTGASGVISSTTTNGAATALYTMVTTAVAAGWTIYKWSDGTTVTTGSAGFSVANLSHANAWCVFEEPGGLTRSYMWRLIQNASPTGNFYTQVYYSPRNRFTTGGTGAVAPTASDQVGIESSITAIIHTQSVQLRINVCASDVAINGVYPLVMHCYSLGTTTQTGVFVHDAVIAGSVNSGDPEPLFSYIGLNWGSSTIKFRTGFGTGSATEATMAAATSQLDFDGAHAVDPIANEDVAGRFRIYSSTIGHGYSNWLLLKGQSRAYPNRSAGSSDTYTYVGTTGAGILLASPDGVDLTV